MAAGRRQEGGSSVVEREREDRREPGRTPARRRQEPAYASDRAQILRRLARIEGQVRGIARMVERDEYCIDILQQTAALRSAVDGVTMLLMEDHVAGCLATAVRTGDAGPYTEEVMDVVRRSMGRPVRGSRPAGEG
jgi:CsoR family transcriptional regulator, copper-sensing transcriptional repressor